MAQERKLVTVLFADIVGSTRTVGSVDPEIVRETLDRAFDALQRVLVTHGATVEKFIGDAVMAVFGAPTTHDDDPDRAVRAAFACRDAIANFGRVPLELRIGVNTGEVVAGGAAAARVLVTGEAVNLGSRLEAAAAAGEILVGPLTRQLTARGVKYGESRTIDAKGIGPVECWRAEALLTDVPDQHRGIEGLRAPLIGRDRELRLLQEAYARIEGESRAYLVTVFGPAGSGKSRLIDEFVATLGAAQVRRGRCLPYGDAITFYPLLLILRADAGIEHQDSAEAAIAKLDATVHEAFGDNPDAHTVRQRVSVLAGLARAEDLMKDVAPEDVAEELRWGLRRYLERRAGSVPMTIVFEDIHWAEPAMLELIEHLAEWSRAPLFLVCLARPDLRDIRPGWGGGATNATAIDLSPLGPEDTRRLIAELLAIDDLPEGLRSEVVTRAEGNPLYVEEFLRMLMETGRVERRGDRWVGAGDLATLNVPPTLHGLISARLDRVSPEVKQLLQRGSLAGRLFSTAALAALGDGEAPKSELLREAVRRDLLIEADERTAGTGRVFRFKHVLIRDVAYGALPKAERSRLHDRYGRWLEESLGDRSNEVEDIVAFHAEQAYLLARELGLDGAVELGHRAFKLLRDAGRNAEHRADRHGSRSLYGRAQTVGTDLDLSEQDRIDVEAAVLLYAIQGAPEAETVAALNTLLERARRTGPSETLVRLLNWSLWPPADPKRTRDARRVIGRESLAVARSLGDPELVAETQVMMAGFNAMTLSEARPFLQQSLEEQKASGAKRSIDQTLGMLGTIFANAGEFTTGLRFREEALRISRQTGAKVRIQQSIWSLASGLEHVGDLDRALALEDEGLELAREGGFQWQIVVHLFMRGIVLKRSGRLKDARDSFEEALRLAVGLKLPFWQANSTLSLIDLALTERDLAEASARLMTVSEEDWRSLPAMAARILLCSADLNAARGEPERAEQSFRQAMDTVDPDAGYYVAEIRRHFARFLIDQGRGREAREHVEWLRNYYRDPVAKPRYDEAHALLAECEALSR
jgi:class 3 adenylate cyclase/tetratricopeptide (TPR) repeat protein